MNERIKELERQADEYADGLGLAGDDWCDAQSTKFAELIIRECFKAAMIESKGHMNPIDLMKRMKERVGVEE